MDAFDLNERPLGTPQTCSQSRRALLHDTRDILVTQESEQRWNAAIGASAIRLATEWFGDVGNPHASPATVSKTAALCTILLSIL